MEIYLSPIALRDVVIKNECYLTECTIIGSLRQHIRCRGEALARVKKSKGQKGGDSCK